MSAPGGWLMPEEMTELRTALARERHVEQEQAEHHERQALSIQARFDYERELADVHLGRVRLLDATLLVFAGIENGARVEAMPSPEEEAAHEAAYLAELCVCGHPRKWHGAAGQPGEPAICEQDQHCECSAFVMADFGE